MNFKKELVFLKKQTLFFENKPQFLLILRRKLWKSSRFCIPTSLKLRNTILSLYFMYGSKIKNHVKQLFPLNKKSSYWTKYMLKSFFLTQPVFQNPKVIKLLKTKNILLSKQGLNFFNFETQERTRFYYKTKFNSLVRSIWKRKLLSLTKTRIFTKKKKFSSWQSLRLIRFHRKTIQKRYKKTKARYRRRRKTFLKKKFQYRLPYRREYKNQLKLFTNWRLKYLIQDFIQRYFAVRLYVKLLWPLAEFKNLKFYRIVFPKKTSSKTKRISLRVKIHNKRGLLRKRYVFISRVTNHVRLQNQYKLEKKQDRILRKIKKMLALPFKKKNSRR